MSYDEVRARFQRWLEININNDSGRIEALDKIMLIGIEGIYTDRVYLWLAKCTPNGFNDFIADGADFELLLDERDRKIKMIQVGELSIAERGRFVLVQDEIK